MIGIISKKKKKRLTKLLHYRTFDACLVQKRKIEYLITLNNNNNYTYMYIYWFTYTYVL